ncbi:MAG: fructokinase, partial [Rhodomicrobium sp.]|nr:fructokinase [Rhodomicrobium sp.]
MRAAIRLGIDLGGTKIAITALGACDEDRFAKRIPTPRGDYAATVAAMTGLVRDA